MGGYQSDGAKAPDQFYNRRWKGALRSAGGVVSPRFAK